MLPVVVVGALGSQPPVVLPGKPGFQAMSVAVVLLSAVVGGLEVDFLSLEERRRYLKIQFLPHVHNVIFNNPLCTKL